MLRPFSLLIALTLVAGCGSNPAPDASAHDAAADSPVRADVASNDTATDSPVDDVPLDTASDDTPIVDDTAVLEAGADAATDAPTDTGADVAVDAPVDVATDVPADAPVDAGTDATSGGGCTTNADCTSGLECAFAIADGCSAVGQCVMRPAGSPCGAITIFHGCGCDGSDVMWTGGCHPQFPMGDAPAPIRSMGTCM